ncbi:MAG: hypothetical protein HRU00_15535 [Myxococcales bacterium]|nr:hypothetical protein [Myxococcales bacterium]
MSTILDALKKLERERSGNEDPVYRNISAGAGSAPVQSGRSRRALGMLVAAAAGIALLTLGYLWIQSPRDTASGFPAGSRAEAGAAGTAKSGPPESLPTSGAVPAPVPRRTIERVPPRDQARAASSVSPDASEGSVAPVDRRASARVRAERVMARRAAGASAAAGPPASPIPGGSGPPVQKSRAAGGSTVLSASAGAGPGTPEPAPATPEPVIASEPVRVAQSPEPAPGAQGEPSRVKVLNVRWHPSVERRLVRIQFDQSGPYDLHEGDVVAGVLIYRIHPASVEVRTGKRTETPTLGE